MAKLNDITPAKNQIWLHITSNTMLIIVKIEGLTAYCAFMDEAGRKILKPRVAIPAKKIMCWGNRGFSHVRNRKGKDLKFGSKDDYGVFNIRRKNLGAK